MATHSRDMSGPLVVGILPDQHDGVIHAAATLARKLGAHLLCTYVDEASYLVEWDPRRAAHRLSLHPEKDTDEVRAIQKQLQNTLDHNLQGQGVEWTLHILTGDPSRALARWAEDCDAAMIIVGTPDRRLGHRLSEALNGSISAWLSHHQGRPVLVVPEQP